MGILRLLLALCVVASHVGPVFGFQMTGGSLAVQAFFIISGFYMSLILNEKYVGVNNSFKLFMTNRLLRLYPVYLIVLVLSIFTCFVIGLSEPAHFYPVINQYTYAEPNGPSLAFLIFTNIFIWGQDIVMFLGIHPENGSLFFTSNFWNTTPAVYNFLFIPQGWSLALEMTFYIMAPFLLKNKTSVIVAAILLSLGVRVLIYYFLNLQNDPWTYRFFPNELIFFLFGALSYRTFIRFRELRISRAAGWLMQLPLFAGTIFFEYLPRSSFHIFHFEIKEVCYLVLVIILLPFLFIYSKNKKLDYKIGELSYPIYIVHLMVAKICSMSSQDFLHTGTSVAFLSITAAYGLTIMVSIPMEKYRQRRLKHTKTTSRILTSELINT